MFEDICDHDGAQLQQSLVRNCDLTYQVDLLTRKGTPKRRVYSTSNHPMSTPPVPLFGGYVLVELTRLDDGAKVAVFDASGQPLLQRLQPTFTTLRDELLGMGFRSVND